MSIPLSKLKKYCKYSNLDCRSKSKKSIESIVKRNLSKYTFAPRYLRGLTQRDKTLKKFELRYNTLLERNTGKKSYKKSSIDKKYATSKKSKYTRKWNATHKERSLKDKSKVSGVPLSILKQVYNRGLAAWRGSAHRPGAGQQQWGVARVNSFLSCGKTWSFPDHLLAKKALKSRKVQTFWRKCSKKRLGKKSPSK